ncbi:MAG: Digeranylgeranylglycerophospholipid reductase [Methanocella sp. PtaU1.Bin125]|nr:MAG: Digeranylgeranylglycerophospholipid reductase [Methanocella sp. PtaU1.Bin125]
MEKKDYDVVVVGAGPAGSIAAKYAAKYGAKTLLIEEHGQVGSPVSCTGHISRKALLECELPEDGSYVNKKIRGAFVYAPDGRSIVLDGKRTMTYVVERKIFDRELARQAVIGGADITISTRAERLRQVEGGVQIDTEGPEGPAAINAKVVIGADGVKSKVARAAGLGRLPHVCSAIQVESEYEPRDPEFVEMFAGRSYAPGYFAWSVPTSGDCCRVGLIADENAHVYLDRLLKEHPVVSGKARSAVDLIVGGIPVGTLRQTVADGVMIVGDAAGHVKPISYGGIYAGARCARIAGEVAAKAVQEGDTSARRLGEYEKRWRADLGLELAFGMRFRRMYGRMTDAEMNEAIRLLDDPDIAEVMTRYGDIDRPSALAVELLKVTKSKGIWRLMALLARLII